MQDLDQQSDNSRRMIGEPDAASTTELASIPIDGYRTVAEIYEGGARILGRRSMILRLVAYWLLVVTAAVLGVATLVLRYDGESLLWKLALTGCCIAVLVWAVMVIRSVRVRDRMNSLCREQKRPFQHVVGHVDSDGMTLNDDAISAQYRWTGISGYRLTVNTTVFYDDSNTAIVLVTRSMFPGDHDWREFREIVRGKLIPC